MDHQAIIAAGIRFSRAWEKVISRRVDGEPRTERDVIEMHEATMEMMVATETKDLQSALEVLLNLPS
jgi:hypothetical protein